MKKSLLTLGLLSVTIFYGCGGNGNGTPPNVSQILNEKVAQNPQYANNYASFLASASAKVISVISGIRSSDDIPDFLKNQSFTLPNVNIIMGTLNKPDGTYSCDNGGTYTIVTSQTEKTATFNNCEVSNIRINGKIDYSMVDNNENNIPEKINATFYKNSTIEIVDNISITQNPSPSNIIAKIINENTTFSISGKLNNGDIVELDQNNNIKKVNANVVLNNANVQLSLSDGSIYTITGEQILTSLYKDNTSVKTDTDIKNLVITDEEGNKIEPNFGIRIVTEINPQTNQLKNISLTLKKGKLLSITYNNSLNTIDLENDLNINVVGKLDNGDITKPIPTTMDTNNIKSLDVKADIIINGGYLDTNIMGSLNNIKFDNLTLSINTIDSGNVDREFSINGKIYVEDNIFLKDKYIINYTTEKPFKLSKSEYCPHEGKLNIGDNISLIAYTNTNGVNKLKGMFNNSVLFNNQCNQIDISNPIFGGNTNNNN